MQCNYQLEGEATCESWLFCGAGGAFTNEKGFGVFGWTRQSLWG